MVSGWKQKLVLEITLRLMLEANMCANYRGLSDRSAYFTTPPLELVDVNGNCTLM